MLIPGERMTLGLDMSEDIVLRNFYAPEDGFVWSSGPWCEVAFLAGGAPAPRGAGRARRRGGDDETVLVLDLDVFRAPPHFNGQNVLVYLNGLRVHSALVLGRMNLVVDLGTEGLAAAQNVLTLDLPDATRPADFGLEDERRLGVKIFSLALDLKERHSVARVPQPAGLALAVEAGIAR